MEWGQSPEEANACADYRFVPSIAVLFRFVVLLSIFDEASPSAFGASRPILLETRLSRRLARSGLELRDETFVGLWTMRAFSARRTAVRGLFR